MKLFRALKVILPVFLIIAAATAGGWFAFRPQLEKKALETVRREIERRVDGKVAIGAVGMRFPRTALLENISLTGKGRKNPDLAAKRVSATFNVLALLRGQGAGVALHFDRPAVRFVRFPDGRSNFDGLFRKQGEGEGQPLTVRLDDAELMYEDLGGKGFRPMKFRVEKARFAIDPQGAVRFTVSNAEFEGSAANVKGTFNLDREEAQARIESKALRTKDVKTVLENFGLSEAARVLGKMDFNISARVDYSGTAQNRRTTFEAQSAGGQFNGKPFKTLAVEGSADGNGVQAKRFSLKLADGGSIEGSGQGGSTPGREGEIAVRAKAERFPIETLTSLGAAPLPAMTGSLSGSLDFKGLPSDRKTWAGHGDFNAESGSIDGLLDDGPTPFDRAEGGFTIAAGTLAVERFEFRSPAVDLELKGKIHLEGDLDLSGRAEVTKEKVRTTRLNKIVSNLLPDGKKGYVFRMRVTGAPGSPKVKYSPINTLRRGVQDQVRDVGNKVEKIFKKIF